MTDFLLGLDPELVLVEVETGILRSAIPVIDGTKRRPHPLDDGIVIHDNVNIEFGMKPAASEKEWVDRIRHILKQLAAIIPSHLKMAVIASSEFPDSELEHPTAKEFACDPDFDPYVFEVNEIPSSAARNNLRSCGGHVHVGCDAIAKSFETQAEAAKVLDVFLGIPSLFLDKDPTSERRRRLYGKAGAHRPKPYGVEYRALGNFWVSHPNYARLVFKLVRDALTAWEAGHFAAMKWDRVRATINNNNLKDAEKAMKGFVIPLMAKDTRELYAECLKLGTPDLYKSWKL